MKLLPALILALFTVHAQAANPKLDCSGVRLDVKFGAEKARAGKSLVQTLQALESQQDYINTMLIKSKRKPLTIAAKTQMKMSVSDGYNEAMRRSSEPIATFTFEAMTACINEKY